MTDHWPQLGVGAFVVHNDAILLVQRGQEPGKGEWAIPGGKVMPGETLQAATEREILEETGVAIEVGELAWRFELIRHDENGELQYHYVVLDYYARYIAGEAKPADDVTDARWVRFDEIGELNLSELTGKALKELFAERMATQ